MKLLALALAVLPQIVATNPVTAVGIPIDMQTFPTNGFYGTPLKYRVKLTTRGNGPKPGPTWVNVDGLSYGQLCGEVTWSPTGSGNWTAMCEADVARLDMKVGTSTVKYKIVKTDFWGNQTKDGYLSGATATAPVTIAKVPPIFDLNVQPLKSDVSKRSFKIDMQAKLGLDVPGLPLKVTIGGKTLTTKSGGVLEIPVAPNITLDMTVAFDGDDNLLRAPRNSSSRSTTRNRVRSRSICPPRRRSRASAISPRRSTCTRSTRSRPPAWPGKPSRSSASARTCRWRR